MTMLVALLLDVPILRPTKDNKTGIGLSLALGDLKSVYGSIIGFYQLQGIPGESGNRTQRR